MKTFAVLSTLAVATAAAHATTVQPLKNMVKGEWKLKTLTCNGKAQPITLDYTLTFDGEKGAYISKDGPCTQIEPEKYAYIDQTRLTIKSGVRKCTPNPCKADLPAEKCGKETNPVAAEYMTEVKDNGRTLVLFTDDPKAIDCTDAGQSKPALFVFMRK
jgi:hypothetical protein